MDYPEHEKLKALEGDNNAVGDFIEWLREKGYVIARYGAPYEVQARIDTREIDRDQNIGDEYMRIQAIRRAVRDKTIEVEELAWLTQFAIDNDLVEWSSETGTPGSTGVWGNHVFLGEPGNETLMWVDIRHNEERLYDTLTGTEKLLAEYFDIDPRKISEEKDEMLAAIRASR